MTSKLCLTRKELAGQLGVNRRFVADMIRGGFKFPASDSDAKIWLQTNPHPSKFRKSVAKSHKK